MGVEEQGRFATVNLLDNVLLTGDFADNESSSYRLSPNYQIELDIRYTMDAGETGNYALVKVLMSNDGTNFQEYAIGGDGTPIGSIVHTTLYVRRFKIDGSAGVAETRWYAVPSAAKYIKFQAMESGIAITGGRLTLKGRLSEVDLS